MKIAWGPDAPRRRTSAANWRMPYRLDLMAAASGTRPIVFGGSLCDPFDNAVPDAWRADYWRVLRETENLIWIVVTKRIGNAARMLPADWGRGYPNVMLMATVCNQDEADRDIPKLLAAPAQWRGLSMEPLLGPVGLSCIRLNGRQCLPRLDWVIVGGESGAKARAFPCQSARSLIHQCRAARVAFFLKQIGAVQCWGFPSRFGVRHPKGGRSAGMACRYARAEWPGGFGR